MKRIIVLKGISKSGKSTTIKNLARWIIETYHAHHTIDLAKGDYQGIIYVGNLRIGINSAGDNLHEVEKLQLLKKDHGEFPDIIICASRTKGESERYIRKHFNSHTGWLLIFRKVLRVHEDDMHESHTYLTEELKCRLIGIDKK